jgi:hypothetical protein
VPEDPPFLNDSTEEEDIDLSAPVVVAVPERDLGTPLTQGVTLNPSSEEDEEIVFEECFEGCEFEQSFRCFDV